MKHLRSLLFALAAASLWGAAALAQSTGTEPPPTPPTIAAPKVSEVELPVLTAPKNVNEVIAAEDLTLQNFPEKKARGDVLRDSTQIIGQAARRPLPAGQPLRLIDLQKEQLVKRGEDVSLIFRDGSLEIIASAKAQESGGLGDSIRVMNTGSNRVVSARITGTRQVEIQR